MSRDVSAEVKAQLDMLADQLPHNIGRKIRLLVSFAMIDNVPGVRAAAEDITVGVLAYGMSKLDDELCRRAVAAIGD